MNEWINEWMNEWMSEWVNEWMNEGRKEGRKEWMKEGRKEGRKEAMNEWTLFTVNRVNSFIHAILHLTILGHLIGFWSHRRSSFLFILHFPRANWFVDSISAFCSIRYCFVRFFTKVQKPDILALKNTFKC